MLSDLQEKNRELKEKLGKLRNETKKVYKETQLFIPGQTAPKQTSFDPHEKKSTGSTLCGELLTPSGTPTPTFFTTLPNKKYSSMGGSTCHGNESFSSLTRSTAGGNKMMLSDRAKLVRGETSKRIESLLHEWKDFKDSADEEIKRRSKKEHNLQEIICQTQREKEEIERELREVRSQASDQKNTISNLTDRLNSDEMNRTKLTQLEMQMTSMKRRTTELEYEMQMKDENLSTCQRERDSLLSKNEALQRTNQELRNRIESSESDVTQTQLELEILEQMVKELNVKKKEMQMGTEYESYMNISTQLQAIREDSATFLRSGCLDRRRDEGEFNNMRSTYQDRQPTSSYHHTRKYESYNNQSSKSTDYYHDNSNQHRQQRSNYRNCDNLSSRSDASNFIREQYGAIISKNDRISSLFNDNL